MNPQMPPSTCQTEPWLPLGWFAWLIFFSCGPVFPTKPWEQGFREALTSSCRVLIDMLHPMLELSYLLQKHIDLVINQLDLVINQLAVNLREGSQPAHHSGWGRRWQLWPKKGSLSLRRNTFCHWQRVVDPGARSPNQNHVSTIQLLVLIKREGNSGFVTLFINSSAEKGTANLGAWSRQGSPTVHTPLSD